MDTGALERLCGEVGLKAVFLTPRHQYPTTVTLSLKRRKHVCGLSEKYGFIVIEDDFGAEFQFSGKRLLPLSAMLDKGRYIYIGTFSKIFAPAVRVGYVVADSEMAGKMADYRSLIDMQGDSVAEHALCELYESKDMQRHIRRTSFKKPYGGLAIWLKLDVSASAAAVEKEFWNRGIRIPVFPLPGGGAGLRVGYASLSADETKELVAAIDSVVKSF